MLRHVFLRYNELAELTFFGQADLKLAEVAGLHCLRPNATWAPVSSSIDPRFFQRDDCGWEGWNASGANRCFDEYVGLFGLRFPAVGCPNFYIANAFVVSAAMIRRFSRSTWRRAYARALTACHADGTGGERSSHAVFGGEKLRMGEWNDARWCEQYEAGCAYSPCTRGEGLTGPTL